MTTTKNISVRSYCDRIYDELSDMKSRLLSLIETLDRVEGFEKQEEMVHTHAPHLREIIETIDWKLQILTKVCPADWTRYPEGAERPGSVKEPEKSERESVAGGYMGG